MNDLTEERLSELIARLPPAPAPWVEAATTLPAARATLDDLVERAIATETVRESVLADVDAALRQAGIEPRPELVASLRARLGSEQR
jgi:hypothetical protein